MKQLYDVVDTIRLDREKKKREQMLQTIDVATIYEWSVKTRAGFKPFYVHAHDQMLRF